MPTFLKGLFESKSAPQNPIPRATSNTRSGFYSGAIPNSSQWDIDYAISHGYERVIWVYRCVDAIASNSSTVPMVVREYDALDGKVIEDRELNRLLNRRPNIYETSQQFRYRLASVLLLSRRGAFVEVVRNRAGRPVQLHLLPPGSVTPIPDPTRYVSGYQIQTGTQGLVELEPERVLWIRVKPHPTDVYAQMTPLVAAGLAADTDYLARLYNRNFLANDGRPGLLIAIQGQFDDEVGEEIKRRFGGGPSSAGQTTVIEADGIMAQDMAASPRDVQWQEAVAGSKDDLMLAFGTPESVLGNASGRTFDNADAEEETYWKATLKPFMDGYATGFDILTAGGLEDDLCVSHDYSGVDVLQRQERARHDKALGEFQAGVSTIDQYLEAIGKEPINVPGTQVLWIPQGMVPIGKNDEITKAASSLTPVGVAQPVDPSAAAQQGAIKGTAAGQRAFMNQVSARALRLAGKKNDPLALEQAETSEPLEEKALVLPDIEFKESEHPYEATRRAVEAEIGAHLSAWSSRQEIAVVQRLGGVKARKHTRHWDGQPGTKALDAIYVVNPRQWADDLAESMTDMLETLAGKEALKAARELDRMGVVEKVVKDGNGYPQGRSKLDRLMGATTLGRRGAFDSTVASVKEMIRESALRQSQALVDKINEMDKAGASIGEIKKEVRSMIGSRSSWRKGLSVVAATAAIEGTRNTVYSHGGKYIIRVWKTMHDEKVRPTHRKAYNQRRRIDNPFKVGGAHLLYPGDPMGPIEETANCRCWVEVISA